MRRRALLGTLGTSVTAGCLGNILHDTREVSRFTIDNDSVPEKFPAALSAELLSEPTAEHPARIRVRFEYTGDEPRSFRFSYPAPFADVLGIAANGSKLVLKYEGDPGDHHDGCWWSKMSYGGTATENRRFDPDEGAHVEWSVLTHEAMETCYPSGSYRFEDEYTVAGRAYEWGFHLNVHE